MIRDEDDVARAAPEHLVGDVALGPFHVLSAWLHLGAGALGSFPYIYPKGKQVCEPPSSPPSRDYLRWVAAPSKVSIVMVSIVRSTTPVYSVLTSPWVAGFGSLAGIAALITGIYFYLASEKYRSLTFYVQPVKSVVVSKEQLSSLRVFYRDLQVQDVTTAQIAVWNQGNDSIKMENVLEEIRIVIHPGKADPAGCRNQD